MNLSIAGVIKESIVDGPGIRYTVFAQGCPHKCEGCHNPETHEFGKGKIIAAEDMAREIFKNPYLKGVTFSGGEPFMQASAFYELGSIVKRKKMDIVVFTGYTFEELLSQNDADKYSLLEIADMLIDGRFILKERDISLRFRGSRNQRMLNCRESLKQGRAIEIDDSGS